MNHYDLIKQISWISSSFIMIKKYQTNTYLIFGISMPFKEPNELLPVHILDKDDVHTAVPGVCVFAEPLRRHIASPGQR